MSCIDGLFWYRQRTLNWLLRWDAVDDVNTFATADGVGDMRMTGAGQALFVLTMLVLGALGLFSGDFALVWQPVPAGIPGRTVLACLSGAILCVTSLGVLMRRTAAPASFVLFVYTLVWLLALHVPRVILAPQHEASWGGSGEIMTLVAASWILYASAAIPGDRFFFPSLVGAKAIRWAQILFAVGVPLVGLEHLVYGSDTAAFVPAWLPGRLDWAYFTGVAHIAAGIAILIAVLPRLAAALETLMMGIFTVLVWIPAVVATPAQRFDWTALLMSTVITAAGWVVFESYRGAPWFSFGRTRNRLSELATR
jgi:uncharacterized membrane protein